MKIYFNGSNLSPSLPFSNSDFQKPGLGWHLETPTLLQVLVPRMGGKGGRRRSPWEFPTTALEPQDLQETLMLTLHWQAPAGAALCAHRLPSLLCRGWSGGSFAVLFPTLFVAASGWMFGGHQQWPPPPSSPSLFLVLPLGVSSPAGPGSPGSQLQVGTKT